MAEAPIMPLATDAYLADTTHLSTIEHGAYLLLLMCLWRAGGRLPNDQRQLAKFCRLSPMQFKRVWPVLEPFFFVEGDQIGQGKCDDFLGAVRQKSQKASDSARAKWRKTKKQVNANASTEQCERNAIQDPANPSVAKATDAESVADIRTRIYAMGKTALGADGAKNPGALITKWLAKAPEADVLSAIIASDGRNDRVAFIEGCLKRRAKSGRRDLSVDEDLRQRGIRDAEEFRRAADQGGDRRSPPARDAADDVPRMLSPSAQEERPVPVGDVRDGSHPVSLLALPAQWSAVA